MLPISYIKQQTRHTCIDMAFVCFVSLLKASLIMNGCLQLAIQPVVNLNCNILGAILQVFVPAWPVRDSILTNLGPAKPDLCKPGRHE